MDFPLTVTDLLQRCCDNPYDHLEEQSCTHFDAYAFGYSTITRLRAEKFDMKLFEQVVQADYSVESKWPYNLNTLSFLVAIEGEPAALHRYLHYRKTLCRALKKTKKSYCHFLLDHLGKEGHLRLRPLMYLGNDCSSKTVWSMLSGCQRAEEDTGIQNGKATNFMAGFQAWVETRFPFSRGIRWGRTLHFLSLHSADRSLQLFFEYYDFFIQGEPPDCLSTAGRAMEEMTGTDYAKQVAPV